MFPSFFKFFTIQYVYTNYISEWLKGVNGSILAISENA